MKTLKHFLLLLLIAVNFSASGSKTNEGPTTNNNSLNKQKIKVYYFHNTRRCETCNAVENVTTASLKEFYPSQLENEQITFKSLGLEDESSESLIEKYEVAGPTLLFISGDEIINLTNQGFMYALTKPEKFKKEIRKTVDKLLNLP